MSGFSKGVCIDYVVKDKEKLSFIDKFNEVGKPLGMKFDDTKNQLALIDPKFIEELGLLMTFGAKKYAPDNWKIVDDGKNRYKNALLRHLYAYLGGEMVDKDSGELHLTCVAFNTMALSYFERAENDK